ncbi:MAG: hypothetical protein WCT85_05170 [Parachlamydiales bacterium]|jgi:tetratricopeptide (TPR) repeat protein
MTSEICSLCNRTANLPSHPGIAVTIGYIPKENSTLFRIKKVCDDVFCKDCLRKSIAGPANRINCPRCNKIFKELAPADVKVDFIYKKNLTGISNDDLEAILIEIILNRNIALALTIIENTKCYQAAARVNIFLLSVERQDDAEKIAGVIPDPEHKSLQLINIACSYLENNELENALRVLREAEIAVNLIADPECKSELLLDICQFHLNIFYAYFKLGKSQNCLRLLKNLEKLVNQLYDKENKCLLQVEIAKAYLKSDQIDDLFRLLLDAERTVDLIYSLKKKAELLENISGGYLKIGKFKEVFRLLQKIEATAILTEEPEYISGLLIDLCNNYLELFNTYLSNNKLERAWNFLLEAERIIDQIPDQNLKSPHLKKISDEYLKTKKQEDALRVLQKALISASLITEPINKVRNLMNVSDAYLKALLPEKSLTILREAEKIAMSIPILESKVYLINEIHILQAQCSEKIIFGIIAQSIAATIYASFLKFKENFTI